MTRVTKLIILIIMSLSVYFIYQKTNNTNIKILTIGDSLAMGINSYGIKEYSYSNYYKDYIKSKNKQVKLNDKYSTKDLTIKELITKVKTNNKLKRDLSEAHILILNIGYYDLLHEINIENELDSKKLTQILTKINNNYQVLINNIRNYYNNEIIIVGYYSPNVNNYYLNIGIRKLNTILENNKDIEFIDIYNTLNNKKYFSNPKSYYPNRLGYNVISNKIIAKRLEKGEKF